jgi:hypothetical protein
MKALPRSVKSVNPAGSRANERMQELAEFQTEVSAWFSDNRPPASGFLLPETFMEIDTDAQFQYLRDWQRKIYEAGFLGMA